jgi:disulfide bond formation protein DsbB
MTGSLPTVSLFFALLAVVAQVVTVGTIVLLVGTAAGLDPARRALTAVRVELADAGRWLAAGVAAVATAGSLYLSEIAHLPPCRLCWYQRYAMYPLVAILAVAAWRRGTRLGEGAAILGAATAIIGGSISVWHILIERYPSLETTSACDPTNPCSIIWVERFGYLTIPTMALSGFVLILALLVLSRTPTRS